MSNMRRVCFVRPHVGCLAALPCLPQGPGLQPCPSVQVATDS